MPKQQNTRISPRQALAPAQTGYEVAPVIKASPTDPYNANAVEGGGASDLMEALGIASKTVIPAVLDTGKVWAGEEKKKGVEARFKGEDLDQKRSNAFIDGFERMDGQYKGVQFEAAVKKYTMENSHLSPDEFQQGLDALQQEHLGGLIHQGQLDSFLPLALKAGETASALYSQTKTAEVIQARNSKVQSILEGKLKNKLDIRAAQIGIPLAKGFNSVVTDFDSRAAYDANKEKFDTAIAGDIREILDEARADYKALGLSTRAISANLLNLVDVLGGDAGINLTGYADIQRPEDGNISVRNAFPEAVNKASDRARTMSEHISLAMLRKKEKEEKEALDLRNSRRFVVLATSQDPKDAMKVINDLGKETKMDPNMAFTMANHAYEIMLGQGFARKDNQPVYRQLEMAITSGNLQGQAAYEAIQRHSYELSQPSYQHLTERVEIIENKRKDKKTDHEYSRYLREVNAHQSNILRTLSATDEFGKAMLGLDYKNTLDLQDIADRGLSMYFRGLQELDVKFKGEEHIPGEEVSKLRERVIKMYRPEVDQVVASAMANPGQSHGEFVPPKGFKDSGKKDVNGKRVWVSKDGKQAVVEP